MNKEKLVIIDGNSLLFRAYFAMRPMVTKEGLHTQGIFAFVNMLEKIKNDFKPDYLVVAFDVSKNTFRHEIYKDYKAGRQKTPQELLDEIPVIHDVLKAMNIKVMELESFEADDIIGTVTKCASEKRINSIVITGDKDELQLIDENTAVIINRKGMTEFDEYDEAKMRERYGLTPVQFIDLKGLMGDNSDNLPGVPGVGEKKGIALLREYKTLDNVIENKDNIKGKLGENIRNNIESALMTRRLATIRRDVPIEIKWEEMKCNDPNIEKLTEIYKTLEFNSFLKKLSNSAPDRETDKKNDGFKEEYSHIKTVDFTKMIEELRAEDEIVICLDSDFSHVRSPGLNYLALYSPENSLFSIIHKMSPDVLHDVFDQLLKKRARVIGHGIKNQLYTIKYYERKLGSSVEVVHDTEVSECLIEPNRSKYEVDKMLLSYCGAILQDEGAKKTQQISLFDEQDAVNLDSIKKKLFGIYKIMEKQVTAMKEFKLSNLYYNCELPLIHVLSDMELNGIKVNKTKLEDIGVELSKKISELQNDIINLAGKDFNISSPKQLGMVIFEDLKLPYPKRSKGKTGYYTSADILEKISDAHPIIDKVLLYRKYTKLKSTYIDGLTKLIADDGRIHPHFQQTVAATGRLSCTEPNLQNIPFRDDYGRLIRKAFVADEDFTLVGADYSQIELRIMASLSGDEGMINAFNEGKDIHRITASRVFNIPFDEVTPAIRSKAKAVNFGIIYGMSGFGLSEGIHVSRVEAEKYIENYFAKHPAVKAYLDEQIELGRSNRMVRTLYGRIRQIPEFSSRKYLDQQLAKRLAMNTPIQGTAADIMKFAMIAVNNELLEQNLKSKLILQIHDELIIETHADEISKIEEILRNKMESAGNLAVKLTVDINSSESWYYMK